MHQELLHFKTLQTLLPITFFSLFQYCGFPEAGQELISPDSPNFPYFNIFVHLLLLRIIIGYIFAYLSFSAICAKINTKKVVICQKDVLLLAFK